ncbi:MAG: hypothetical protein WAT66_14665 [Actinomycetota bacterium]
MSLAWIEAITEVLEADEDYWPLTVRYVWYRLIGREINGVVVKKDPSAPGKRPRSLQKVEEKLNRGRRAGLFPWEALHDGGVVEASAGGFIDPSHFWHWVRLEAEDYHRDLLENQPTYVEIWCEAAGLVPRVALAAKDYGVPVYSGGGQNSTSMKHDGAQRIVRDGRSTVLLHIGDLDKFGEHIFGAVFADVPQFVEDYGRPRPEVIRLAVTREQIALFQLPTDEKGQFQAEAVPAAVLDGVIRAALDDLLDENTRQDVLDRSAAEREQIEAIVRHAGG